MDKLNFDKIKNAVDDIKNKVLAENESERRVCEALSNKNWGASSTLMNDIARDTYDFQIYGPIMNILWGALEAPGREWRKVFKALGLLEHLIKHGTELVVEDSRDRLHRIRALTNFSYFEGHNDKASGVREKSKQLLDLLKDNYYIREERNKARKLRNKFVGVGGGGGGYSDYAGGGGVGYYNDSYNRGGGESGVGYQDHKDTYSRSSRIRRGEMSSTGRYSDSPPNQYDRHNNRYEDKNGNNDDVTPWNEDDDVNHPYDDISRGSSSTQNVKKHGSKVNVLSKDPSNTGKATTQQSTAAAILSQPDGGKGEDLLGADNDFADFSSVPVVAQNTETSKAVTPEEDEWDAFKSSSPSAAPISVPVIATQSLSGVFQGDNSASTFSQPQTLLAEMPPQHTENPFAVLVMDQNHQQTPHAALQQQQQHVGFGSTRQDCNSALQRSPNTSASDVQEWGGYTGRPGNSFTGNIGDFHSAPSVGGTKMSNFGKGRMDSSDDNTGLGMNNLVNLGGLQTNALQRQQSRDKNEICDSGRTTSSFRGLDGFSTGPQGTMTSFDSNLNSGGSSRCGLNMWPPKASPGYSVQQQQYEIPKGMSVEPQAGGATGLPQQQMQQSGQWPIMGQLQPGVMGGGIPPAVQQTQKNQTGGSQFPGSSNMATSTSMGGPTGSTMQ